MAIVAATALIAWHLHKKGEAYKIDRDLGRAVRILAPLRISVLFMYAGVLWEGYQLVQLALSDASP